MNRHFLYLYFMKDEPEMVPAVVPAHVRYWQERNLQGYRGGPFSDRTGGLITFEAGSLEIANDIVQNDPFILEGLIKDKLLKQWMVE